MERFKNYGLWVSIAALIPLILQVFGVSIVPDYEQLVNAILGILVMAGIISNPTTTNKWYGEDKSSSPSTPTDTTPPTK